MILCLETATKNCSVSLVSENAVVHHRSEHADKFVHGERLHLLIKECVDEAGISFEELDAVCVGKGPGSYTGLRIGVSAAKGICYASKKPLYSLPTLGCFSFDKIQEDLVITVIDARRDEVYAQKWLREGTAYKAYGDVASVVVNGQSWSEWSTEKVRVMGDAAEKVGELHGNTSWVYSKNDYPSALHMPRFLETAEMVREDVAYFEPFYLKDFVALKSSKKLL
jgi:tRNA threonylcarbamoyladenosine biosynthesis protein TsaB